MTGRLQEPTASRDGNIHPQTSFIRQALATVAGPEARRALLALYLHEQAARILRLSPSQLDPQQPLGALGLDSLLAVELRNEIETGLGIDIPLGELLQGASLAQMSDAILTRLDAPPAPPIKARLAPAGEAVTEFPLAYGQQALWFLHQLSPQSAAYNIPVAVKIGPGLNAPALQRAFQALLDRHPALRAAFAARQGEPGQRVNERATVCFITEQAQAWSEAALSDRLTEEAHRPFDLENGPLLRVHLFARPAGEHVLLLVIHHIAADLWSLAVLAQELAALYAAAQAAAPSSLPPAGLQYSDYVRWQRERLSGADGERLWTYWQRQLSGPLPLLNLAGDRRRPPAQTHHGATCHFRIGEELTGQVKELARTGGATLYVALLAAFQALLYRYTGQDDLLVGSPAAGRSRAELAGLVGYLVNPLLLRAKFGDDPTFAEHLARARDATLAALAHQDYPFNLLVERLQPERDPSRSPLFQVMFILQQAPPQHDRSLAAFALGQAGAQMSLGGLSLTWIGLQKRVAQFDLTLAVAEVDGCLVASLEYNTDLFDAATMARLAGHWQTLLTGVVARPGQRLGELPLLTPAERQQLLVEWNDSAADYAQGACLHHLFEAQAARTPDAIAVVWQEAQLTYCQLNRRANQLARCLRRLGVGPEILVGVCLDRSPDVILGLLGVLKAGGGYLPLDPEYPAERLAFTLQDAGASLLLTQRRLLARLPERRIEAICLDAAGEPAGRQHDENPAGGASPQNLAYVIYTSGSTGAPKGVAIAHRSAVALLDWAKKIFDPPDAARILASTSICFDLSVFELFAPLGWGGRLILADDVLRLPALPAAQDVSLINTVPSAMAELLAGGRLPASVRIVNLAGESLPHKLAQQIYQSSAAHRLFNLYGPTEDTTYSTFALIRPDADLAPPIGRPVANTRLYLLDARLQPLPVGLAGRLYLAGLGLARGYLHRPALTAERFIPHPLSQTPGARLYHTGDLARYLPDGNVEFLGRADHQVKVRGFRIELGEVEAVLGQHPAVQETVVVARQDAAPAASPGLGQRLVAYVAPAPEQAATAGELRRFLQERLPDYMLPSAFVSLAALPLTANGKIDRSALPAPDATRPELEAAFVAPRTPTEKTLADLWAETLGLEQIGVFDNFFELGGHSLKATQLVARAHQAFGVTLPVAGVFEHPTIAELACLIDASPRQTTAPDGSIRPVPRGDKTLDDLLKELEGLSEEEIAAWLDEASA